MTLSKAPGLNDGSKTRVVRMNGLYNRFEDADATMEFDELCGRIFPRTMGQLSAPLICSP
jgi:hypothetical protein